MSQAGIINTSGGSVPPTVATSYVTNSGTAIPAANVLNVLGNSVDTNNVNGIQTAAVAPNSNNLYIQLTNRFTSTLTTTDATSTPIFTFSLPSVGVYAFETKIAAYNTTDGLGAAYDLFYGIISVGGAASKLGLEDKIVNEQGGMTTCNASVSVNLNTVIVSATGLAGKTIKWLSTTTYTYVGA